MNNSILFQNLIKELGLVPEHFFHKTPESGLYVFRTKYGNTPVLAKFVAKTNETKLKSYIKEKDVDAFLAAEKVVLSDDKFRWPRVKQWGENKDFFWLIREYLDGDSLAGEYEAGEALFGYDRLRPDIVEKADSIMPEIVTGLGFLRKINQTEDSKAFLDNRSKKNLEECCLDEISSGLGVSLKEQLDFYNSNKNLYTATKNIGATVGDLVPGNILISRTGDVLLSDFEWFSFDNYMMDTAFLWLFLWRYPGWQQALCEISVKSDKDEIFFRQSIIRHVINWYNYSFRPEAEKVSYFKKRREEYKNHYWTRALKNAAVSYEGLIKTR